MWVRACACLCACVCVRARVCACVMGDGLRTVWSGEPPLSRCRLRRLPLTTRLLSSGNARCWRESANTPRAQLNSAQARCPLQAAAVGRKRPDSRLRNIETDAGRAVRKERRCDVMSASNIPAAQTRRQRLCVHVTRSEGSPSAASSDGLPLLLPAPPKTPAAERRARVTRTADKVRKDESAGRLPPLSENKLGRGTWALLS